MKTLAEFLAENLGVPIEEVQDGIKAYWAMIEKQLISALEKMEGQNKKATIEHTSDCASHNNPPAGFASSVTDCDCKAVEDMTTKELIENDCSCQPIGSPCIHNVKHPICPLNLYFEGDENKINLSKCDFENRGCTNACKIEINEAGFHEVGN